MSELARSSPFRIHNHDYQYGGGIFETSSEVTRRVSMLIYISNPLPYPITGQTKSSLLISGSTKVNSDTPNARGIDRRHVESFSNSLHRTTTSSSSRNLSRPVFSGSALSLVLQTFSSSCRNSANSPNLQPLFKRCDSTMIQILTQLAFGGTS